MGGKYPTTRRVDPRISYPTGTPRLPEARPRRKLNPSYVPPVRPGTFDPGPDNDMPGVKRNWGWPKGTPSNKPFGKAPKRVYPSPLGPKVWRRLLPWGGAGAAFVAYMLRPGGGVVGPAGWTKCYDLGGPKEMQSGPVGFIGCSFVANFQPGVPMGSSWPTDPSWDPIRPLSVWFGPDVHPSVPGTRMNYTEQWVLPAGAQPAPGTPLIREPPAYIFPDPWLPLDPNFWLPLQPQPYSPNIPRKVWPNPKPKPQPRTWPRSVKGNSLPNPLPTPKPIPDLVITGTGVSLRPNNHRRLRPRKPYTHETKYTMRGPFMGLASLLLSGASKVYNGITELVDLLTAIYESLPADVIAREPDYGPGMVIPGLLESLWRNADKIDMRKAVANIAKNQIEDAVWGRYFKAIDDVQKKGGPYYSGYDRELSQLNDLFRELYGS